MRTIARDEIIQVWEELCSLQRAATESLVKQFMEEQPALGIYVSAFVGEQVPDSRSIDLTIASWKAFSKAAGQRLKRIKPKQIEGLEEANTAILERLEEGSETDFMGFARSLIDSHNQRELIAFALEVLMSGHEENPELAPETIGLELLCVQTVVEALDKYG